MIDENRTGKAIRHYRELRGLTLEDVGKKLGVQKTAVYKWEQGIVSNIPMPRLIKLAEVLDVEPSALMGFEDEYIQGRVDEDGHLIKEYQVSIKDKADLKIVNDVLSLNAEQKTALEMYIKALKGISNEK